MDRPFRPCLAARLQTFVRMAQRFFQEEMARYGYRDSWGQGKTFPFEKDSKGLWNVVFMVGEHDSSWYQERSPPEDPGREPFAEMLRRLPDAFHNNNVTLYFYDIAEVRDGGLYYSGQGGTAAPWEGEGAGWALIGAHVLGMGFDTLALDIDEQAVLFEDMESSGLPDFDGDSSFHVLTKGQYASTDLGAAIHELGHTFSLLHDFVDWDSDGIETNLMGNGFRRLSGRYTPRGYLPATRLGPTQAAELDRAILFNEGLPPSELLLDDGDPGTAAKGTWRVSGGPYPYGVQSLYSNEAGAAYSFTLLVPEPGLHEVALRWTGWSSRLPDVPVSIEHAAGTSTVGVDQTRDSGKWVPVGSYEFDGSATVTIISSGGGSTCADGVRLTRSYAEPAPEALILDNGEPGTTAIGYWPVSAAEAPYGETSVYSKVAGATYSFELPLPSPGSFDVYLWWTQYPSRRADVPIDIVHAAGTSTVQVDQTVDGGMWNRVGRYAFGSSARIVVRSLGGGTTCADAVKLVPATAPPPPLEAVLDNGEPGTTAIGYWPVSAAAAPYGESSLYSKVAGAAYSFELPLPSPGSFDVYLWWTDYTSRRKDVPIDIVHASGTSTVQVDQTVDGGMWNRVGRYAFGSSARIVVRSLGGGTTCADAVKLVSTTAPPPPLEAVLDNGEPGTTAVGPWSLSGGAKPYGAGSLYSKTAGATYRFHFAPTAGSYEVFLWWTEYPSRQPNVPIHVQTDGAGQETRHVDQTRDGGQWVSIGEFAVASSIEVTVECTGIGSTCADAVRIVKR